MSTKSTILNTPSCHIYHDYAYQHGDAVSDDKGCEVLVIEASCGNVEMYGEEHLNESNDMIIVRADSDFAKTIRFMIEKCGANFIESTYIE